MSTAAVATLENLETLVVKLLQLHKQGLTMEEMCRKLGEPREYIFLRVLPSVAVLRGGRWHLKGKD